MDPTSTPFGPTVPTEDGSLTLAHPEHGETYHSHLLGAQAEAEQLYIHASGIQERFAAPLGVLDVGLGLGYNALATLVAWHAAPAPAALALVSLEVDAALVTALAAGNGPWQANWSEGRLAIGRALERCDEQLFFGEIAHPSGSATCRWEVRLGDAATEDVLGRRAHAPFDFVWQDPFSPQKNPTMWSADWFARVRAHAAPGCRLQTYSVARAVRDALSNAGWSVAKIPTTTPRKKHWLRAVNDATDPVADGRAPSVPPK